MKKGLIPPVFCLLLVLTAIGGYWRGRRDVRIEDFKVYRGDLIAVTSFETNVPPELTDFLKGRYYYVANRLSKSRLGNPYDYGEIGTNRARLAIGKGPTSAQAEYRRFKERGISLRTAK